MTPTSLNRRQAFEQSPNPMAYSSEWADFDVYQLLDLARRSVLLGLSGQSPLIIRVEHYSQPLQREQSTFVTLRDRGTILSRAGTVRPVCPIAANVCHNAYEAACRAVPLAADASLSCDVQIVSPLQFLNVTSWEEVLRILEERRDGVHVQYGPCHATFTPDKWEELPVAADFLLALQRQAGLDPAQWSRGVRVATYQVTQLPPVKVEHEVQLPVRRPK